MTTKTKEKPKIRSRGTVIPFDSYRDWEKVLQGDRDTFKRITEAYLPELLDAARREINYQQHIGSIDESVLQPEELAGETLIKAWQYRARRPEGMSLKGWLLGVQRQALQKIIAQEKRFRELAAISLESPVPKKPIYDDDESFWEWHQPDDFNRWEDLIPDDMPTPEEMTAEHEAAAYGMEEGEREAMYLYHLHRLPVEEVATIMRRTVKRTVAILESGSESYRRAVDINV